MNAKGVIQRVGAVSPSWVDKGVTLASFVLILWLVAGGRRSGAASVAVPPSATDGGAVLPAGVSKSVEDNRVIYKSDGQRRAAFAVSNATASAAASVDPRRFVRFQGYIQRPGARACAIIGGERYTVGRMTPEGVVERVGAGLVVLRGRDGARVYLVDWRPVESGPEGVTGGDAAGAGDVGAGVPLLPSLTGVDPL